VDDPGELWLEQAFDGQVPVLKQFRIHRHFVGPIEAADKEPSARASFAGCQLPDSAACWMVRAKKSGSCLSYA
jgi:hypothetical protein